jgi:hypothetical protein
LTIATPYEVGSSLKEIVPKEKRKDLITEISIRLKTQQSANNVQLIDREMENAPSEVRAEETMDWE